MSEYTSNSEREYTPEQNRRLYEFLKDKFAISEDPYETTRYFRLGNDRFAITNMHDWKEPFYGLAIQYIDYLDPSNTDAGDFHISANEIWKIVVLGQSDQPFHISLPDEFDYEWPEISEPVVPSEDEVGELISQLSRGDEVTRETVVAEIKAAALRREG